MPAKASKAKKGPKPTSKTKTAKGTKKKTNVRTKGEPARSIQQAYRV